MHEIDIGTGVTMTEAMGDQVTDMVIGTVVAAVMEVVVVMVTADPGKHGVLGIGNVTDAERIILPAEDVVTHAAQTNCQKGVTAAGVMAVVAAVATVTVAVAVAGMTEEHRHSSLETGTAQIAMHTTLQAAKPATSATRPNEGPILMQMPICLLLRNCLCRLAGMVWLHLLHGCGFSLAWQQFGAGVLS